MRKVFMLIFLIGCFQADVMQAQGKFTATFEANANSITFKFRPTATITKGFSTIEFFLRYPTATAPFTYGPVVANTTNFPGMTSSGIAGSGSWQILHNESGSMIAGYNVDHFIYTAPAPITTNTTYNIYTEYELITVPINGIVPTNINYQFVHQNTEVQYYLAISDEIGGDLRPASFNSYFYPATSTITGPSGSIIYYQDRIVPLKWLNLNVQKQNNNALVTWQVVDQMNTDYFEVQAGVDPNKLVTIGKVASTSADWYSFVHYNYINLQGQYVYYRIKQVDKDGKLSYSHILKLNLDEKQFSFDVVENPVTGNTLNIAIQSFAANKGLFTVFDLQGKKLMQQNISWVAGSNQKLITLPVLANGIYSAILQVDNQQYSVKFVK